MKKIFIMFLLSFFMNDYVCSQTSKIDVMGGEVYVYDELNHIKKTCKLDSVLYRVFISEFCDSTNLTTINISLPIKRLIKFYGIYNGGVGSWVELPYSEMGIHEKHVVDAFINSVIYQ